MSPNSWYQLDVGLAIGTFIGMVVHYKLGNFRLAFILMFVSAILVLVAVVMPKEDEDERG